MTQIFISHSHDDVACAERIRQDLEVAGYAVWKDTQNIAPGSVSYVRAIEGGIRGSAATIVLWSATAATSEWVEREVLFSQQLQKPIYPVFIDQTPPGVLLVAAQNVRSAPPCADAVGQLLSALPPLDRDKELLEALQLLSHPHIRQQKEGVQKAAEFLKAGKYREPVLAALEDIVRKGLYQTVRDAAQGVIDAEKPKESATAASPDSRHMIAARCPKGHISYFDKRRICPDQGTIKRVIATRGDTKLDDIYLKCAECGEEMIVPVDCEGYR
jgi:hypothetical protein